MKAYKLSGYTILDYQEREASTGLKHEYHNGNIRALAGGSLNHGLIGGNVSTSITRSLEKNDSKCFTLNSDVKLHIEKTNSYVYPDTMVICGAIEVAENDKNAVTNPILIVEVLSKSTADYDRGDKFYIYRKIPTFKEYVLVEQDKYVVDVHYRKNKGALWQIKRYSGKEEIIQLKSIDVKIKMEDLFKRVKIGE